MSGIETRVRLLVTVARLGLVLGFVAFEFNSLIGSNCGLRTCTVNRRGVDPSPDNDGSPDSGTILFRCSSYRRLRFIRILTAHFVPFDWPRMNPPPGARQESICFWRRGRVDRVTYRLAFTPIVPALPSRTSSAVSERHRDGVFGYW